jgi:hypothetical protein
MVRGPLIISDVREELSIVLSITMLSVAVLKEFYILVGKLTVIDKSRP